MCNNGEYLMQSCGGGLKWNAFSENCDHAQNVDCSRADIEAASATAATTAAPGVTVSSADLEQRVRASANDKC